MGKKKKLGRPLSSPLPRNNVVGLRLNDLELECLARYAWRYEASSLQDVIREALMILSVIPEAKKLKA